jgi:hypothetical protein
MPRRAAHAQRSCRTGQRGRLAFPNLIITIGEGMMNRPLMTRVAGGVWLALGALLTWQGYF